MQDIYAGRTRSHATVATMATASAADIRDTASKARAAATTISNARGKDSGVVKKPAVGEMRGTAFIVLTTDAIADRTPSALHARVAAEPTAAIAVPTRSPSGTSMTDRGGGVGRCREGTMVSCCTTG